MRVGLTLPQYDTDFPSGTVDAGVTIETAHSAGELGFDSVWLSDHPFIDTGGVRVRALEPTAMLGALSAAAPGVEIGTLVLASSMRGPAEIYSLAASLAAIAPGRVRLGLGTGWNPATHAVLGIELPPYPGRTERLRANLLTAAAFRPDIAVLVGGIGGPTVNLAVAHADIWNVAWNPSPADVAAANRHLDAVCVTSGRDPWTLRRSVGVRMHVVAEPSAFAADVARLARRHRVVVALNTTAAATDVVVGDMDACATRLAEYSAAGADEIVLSPLAQGDASAIRDIAGVVEVARARL